MPENKDQKDNKGKPGFLANIVSTVKQIVQPFSDRESQESTLQSQDQKQEVENNGRDKREIDRPSRAAQYKEYAEQVVVIEDKKEKVIKDLPQILPKLSKEGKEKDLIAFINDNPFLKDHEYKKGHSIMYEMILGGNWTAIEIMFSQGIKFTVQDIKSLSLANSDNTKSGNLEYKSKVLQTMMKHSDESQAKTLREGLSEQIQEYFEGNVLRTQREFINSFVIIKQVLLQDRNILAETVNKLEGGILQTHQKLLAAKKEELPEEIENKLKSRLNGLIKQTIDLMVASAAGKKIEPKYIEELNLADNNQVDNFKQVLSKDWVEGQIAIASQVKQWFKGHPKDQKGLFLEQFKILRSSLAEGDQKLFDKKLDEIYQSKDKVSELEFSRSINQLVAISGNGALISGRENKIVDMLKEYPDIKTSAIGYGILFPYIVKEDWKTVKVMIENGVDINNEETLFLDFKGGNKDKNEVLQKMIEQNPLQFGRIIKNKMLEFVEKPEMNQEGFRQEFGALREIMPQEERLKFDKMTKDVFQAKELTKRRSEFGELEKESGIKGLINKLVIFCLKIIGKIEAKEKGFLVDYETIVIQGEKDQSSRKTKVMSESAVDMVRTKAEKEKRFGITEATLPNKPDNSPAVISPRDSSKTK